MHLLANISNFMKCVFVSAIRRKTLIFFDFLTSGFSYLYCDNFTGKTALVLEINYLKVA